MNRSRKIIPLTPVMAPEGSEEEHRGCAELEPFVLRVVGDSMTPEFVDGHVIVLDPGLPAVHETYVVVDVDGEIIFRQFLRDGERVFLKALNDAYPAIELTGEYKLLGVVTQRAGRRRADRKRYD